MSRDVGLTVPQLLCLKAIVETELDEITPAEVGRQVHLSASTVTRILDRLERADLIRRERTSTDRRKVSLVLTDYGRERYRDLPTPLQERFLANLGDLDVHEQQALLHALQRVVELMEAQRLDAAPMLTPGETVQPNSD